MKTKTTDTPRTDEACEAMGLKAFVVPVETSSQLERELAEKTNEVERLRELLNGAIEIADESWDAEGYVPMEFVDRLQAIKEEARLAPAPEEPVTEKDTKVSVNDQQHTENVNDHWRELGPDEVIQEGDECRYKGEAQYEPLMDSMIGGKPKRFRFYLFRTCRPLPKKEEIPSKLDAEIEVIDTPATYSVTEARHATADAIRYLRDEIQKLKTQTHYHHESYCRKCKEPK
jgi:hypothetical protein